MHRHLGSFAIWLRSPTGVAVNALGIVQIVAWGTTLYSLAVLGAPISDETGWSPSLVFGGLSLGLLISGVISTWTGRLIDTLGARAVMTVGSALNAVGLAAWALAPGPAVYLAAWALLGVSMRFTLYDAAFAALVQVTPARGRRAISLLTLWGGFASTVFWPIGHALEQAVGWRDTCLVFAALNLALCLPLSWWGLARRETAAEPTAGDTSTTPAGGYLTGREQTVAMVLFSVATSSYAFIFGAASVHLVALIEASGVAAGTAVALASLKGVAQVGGRIWEIVFARDMKPLNLARVPVWLMPIAFVILIALAGGVVPALVFTLSFGVANGLVTIVRGALPLALFGSAGYGRILGVLATPYLLINALAPLVFAVIVERGGYPLGQWVLLGCALLSLAAMELLSLRFGKR